MEVYLYLEINFISIFLIFTLYTNSLKNQKHSTSARVMNTLFILVTAILVLDQAAWFANGKPGDFAKTLLMVFNSANFCLVGIIAFFWFLYVLSMVRNEELFSKWIVAVTAIPAVASVVLSLISPFCNIFFTINSDNTYSRANGFWVLIVISFIYLFSASVLAFRQFFLESQREKKKQFLYISSFIFFPIIGIIVQTLLYGTEWIWPLSALSLLTVYINIQNQQISLDGLTGINNRGQFNKYLSVKCETFEKSPDDLYLILMDINNFKLINDNFGHSVGDKALIDIAQILKDFFAGENVFLSRYGGDEFAIILDTNDETTIKKIVKGLHTSVYKFNMNNKKQYNLSISIGYSMYGIEEADSPEKLIVRADKMMYDNKRNYKINQSHGQ